jgi:hypothetical protein
VASQSLRAPIASTLLMGRARSRRIDGLMGRDGAETLVLTEQFFGSIADIPITVTSGIASGEAFGTAQIGLTVHATGIASVGAFGTPVVSLGIIATGIASAEAFGAPVVGLTIHVAGIASAEAFGTARVDLGIVVAGIASAEAFGLHVVELITRVAVATEVGSSWKRIRRDNRW